MSTSLRIKSASTLFILILLCGSLLTGCVGGRFSPDGWSGPMVLDQTLYVISHGGEFLAVDLANPNGVPVDMTPRLEEESSSFLGCESSSGSDLVAYATPLISDGIAYVGDYEGKVYAIDVQSKVEVWRPAELGDPIVADLTRSGNTLIAASGKELYAISTEDGSRIWTSPFEADGKIWGNPVISGGNIYFGSLGQSLYCVGLQSGQLVWERSFNGAVASAPLVVDGIIYVGTFESKFYAIEAETGSLVWDEPFKADDWFWSKAVYSDGTVYVGSFDQNVYAIDAATGKAKNGWMTPLLDGPVKSAAIIVEDVLLIACKCDLASVYGFDLQTGQEKWRPGDLGKIYADPWVDGTTVYYLNRDDEVYGLEAASGTIVQSISLDFDR